MIARGRTHGTVSFLHRAGRQARDASRLAALEDLTSRAAIAYDNARLYAERARVARTLRRSLMPAGLPSVPGIELASFFRPVGAGEEVGGDFFDVFRHGHCCWLVVGDVCGKGAEAAALTAFLRHTTMAYARDAASPSHVLRRVNQAMLEQDFDGRFATMLLARLEPIGAGVEALLASGGHPPALRARLDGEVQQVGTNGTLLGVFDDPAIGDATVLLGPGDMLALYTDGLIDAHAPGRTVTVAEMAKRLRGSLPRRSEEVVEALLALVDLDAGVRDDIAILAAQVDPLIARDPHSSDAAARHRAVSRSGRVRGAAE
jgi:serine phosphatase RsbU (regulator of sigma subunit)